MVGGAAMATGIGAPVGAVLFGIGSAASTISSMGLMIEGLFDKKSAPAPVVPKKTTADYAARLHSMRRR